jgi:chemotaxis protein methyltransferase CheR
MLHDARNGELARALSAFGLDLVRYTPALTQSFLKQWPTSSDWYSGRAKAALISTFAIGETTFLRHPEQFAAVRALIRQLRMERGAAPLRAFSAGCASGEEAYSLAATLAADQGAFEVVAWDVNPDAIARAREGVYRPWSLRGVAAESTGSWLEPSPCGVRVVEDMRKAVRFEVANLHTDAFPKDLDLIFCRNVLLYFRPELAAQVLTRLTQALRPGGVLILGHYDPRPPASSELVAETLDDVLFYRRTGGAEQPPARQPRPLSFKPPQPTARIDERYRIQPLPGAQAGSAEAQMQLVRVQANQRRTAEALSLLQDLTRREPLRPEVHVLTALVAEDAGDTRLMLAAARRACFLVPDHAAPNYFLSVAFLRSGELRRAALHRRVANVALRSASHASSILDFSEGLTVGQLRRLIGAIGR